VRRIPIHVKLAAALAFPLLGLLAVAAYEVVESSRRAAAADRQVDMTEAVVGPGGLFNALQDERNRATVDLVGMGDLIALPVADNAEARSRTDAAMTGFRQMVGTRGDEVRAAYAPVLDELEALAGLRDDVGVGVDAGVDAGPGPGPDEIDSNPPSDPTRPACGESACRPSIDNWMAADEVFTRYTTMVDALLDASSRVALSIDDPGLRRGADISFLAARQADTVARLVRHVLVTGIGAGGFDQRAEMVELGTLHGRAARGEAELHMLTVGPYAEIAAPAHEHSAIFLAQVQRIIDSGRVDVAPFLDTLDTGPDETYDGSFRAQVKAIVGDEAARLQDAAERRVRLFRVLAAVAALIAGVATWIVSRSITRPLRSLTHQATRMAHHRLPGAVAGVLETPPGDDVAVPRLRPVAVRTRDEVAEVAAAVNTVQTSALDLAVSQALLRRNVADSLVNLGRRNQALVARQLAFITELEHGETDPEVLADLFRLDHLATRMRRHADSLVVLAGGERGGGERGGGERGGIRTKAPVNVTDAVRAALGEVEDYQRVALRRLEPATIHGGAAADLAHLVAELLENGLTYSPPDQAVEIRGRCRLVPRTVAAPNPATLHHGLAMGYTLAVVDHGVGMPPPDLERANRRLAGAESFTIAPSKYLGHYVAGRLAARHGITVTLRSATAGRSGGLDPGDRGTAGPGPSRGTGDGVTATIDIPPDLVASAAPRVVEGGPVRRNGVAPSAAQPTRSPA
jgi:signal transduction histidine kinase